MNTAVSVNSDISIYWDSIRFAPTEIKLKLISLLSESILPETLPSENKKEKENVLSKFYGSWKESEGDPDLLELIQGSRSSKPIIPLD